MINLYRMVLHLLPTALRRKHGAEMTTLFARELEHARAQSRLHEIVVGVRGIWDVMQRSAYELVRNVKIPMGDLHMPLPTTRQLLRRHAFSFGISFVGLSAVLLSTYARKQLPALSARGDSASIIAQALLLAVPFVAAMTIPMSVLLSVLYEFTRLGRNGTLAAARLVRSGVRQLVVPVVFAAVGVTAFAFVVTAEIVPRANERLANVLAGAPTTPGDRSMTIGQLRAASKNVAESTDPMGRSRAVSYDIEFQKKLALPTACLFLAIAGMALAFRMPRGGVGLVIGGSLAFFAAYYAVLVTGETLADRLIISPFVAMWGANAFVLTVALLAVWRSGPARSTELGVVARS